MNSFDVIKQIFLLRSGIIALVAFKRLNVPVRSIEMSFDVLYGKVEPAAIWACVWRRFNVNCEEMIHQIRFSGCDKVAFPTFVAHLVLLLRRRHNVIVVNRRVMSL